MYSPVQGSSGTNSQLLKYCLFLMQFRGQSASTLEIGFWCWTKNYLALHGLESFINTTAQIVVDRKAAVHSQRTDIVQSSFCFWLLWTENWRNENWVDSDANFSLNGSLRKGHSNGCLVWVALSPILRMFTRGSPSMAFRRHCKEIGSTVGKRAILISRFHLVLLGDVMAGNCRSWRHSVKDALGTCVHRGWLIS